MFPKTFLLHQKQFYPPTNAKYSFLLLAISLFFNQLSLGQNFSTEIKPKWIQHVKGFQSESISNLCALGTTQIWATLNYHNRSEAFISNGTSTVKIGTDTSLKSQKFKYHTALVCFDVKGELMNLLPLISSESAGITHIISDADSNLIVSGYFKRDLLLSSNDKKTIFLESNNSFTYGSGTFQSPSHLTFTAKYNSKGNLLWAHKAGTPTENCLSKGLQADAKGNIYNLIYVPYHHTFITDSQIVSSYQYNSYLISYSPKGDERWMLAFHNHLSPKNLQIGKDQKLQLFSLSLGYFYIHKYQHGKDTRIFSSPENPEANYRFFNFDIQEDGDIKNTDPVWEMKSNLHTIQTGKLIYKNNNYYWFYNAVESYFTLKNKLEKTYQSGNPNKTFVTCFDPNFQKKWEFLIQSNHTLYAESFFFETGESGNLYLQNHIYGELKITSANGSLSQVRFPKYENKIMLLTFDENGNWKKAYHHGNLNNLYDGYAGMGDCIMMDKNTFISAGLMVMPGKYFGVNHSVLLKPGSDNRDTMAAFQYYKRYDAYIFSLDESQIEKLDSINQLDPNTNNPISSNPNYHPTFDPILNPNQDPNYNPALDPNVKEKFFPVQFKNPKVWKLENKTPNAIAGNNRAVPVTQIYPYPPYVDSVMVQFNAISTVKETELQNLSTKKKYKFDTYTRKILPYGNYLLSYKGDQYIKKYHYYLENRLK